MDAVIREAWYVAAWDHEVQGEALFERQIIGQSLLFYRTADGTVVALSNKCCHRHAPLVLGRREGDCVRCMYHGLKYDATGRCVEIPGQQAIPAAVRIRSYPVIERRRWIWVWMGEAAPADPDTLPDTFSLADPAWRMKPGYLHYAANHHLISDNLLDFSHLSYVHAGTLGGTPQIAEVRAKMERLARGVRLRREVRDSVPAPNHVQFGARGRVDRWWVYDYVLPGILLLESGVKPAAQDASGGPTLRFHSCQALTPESDTTTHYFFAQAHGFALEDGQVTEALHQGLLAAFDEDRRMIEAQQRLIERTERQEMLGLPIDAALGAYRRLYEQALRSDAAG